MKMAATFLHLWLIAVLVLSVGFSSSSTTITTATSTDTRTTATDTATTSAVTTTTTTTKPLPDPRPFGKLPRLYNGALATMHGLSAGADMAAQFMIAYSDLVAGVGVFAGQAYRCAVTRFSGDALTPLNPSVPVCDGCPFNRTLHYDHCKRYPEIINTSALIAYAQAQDAARTIAPLSTLKKRKFFLYRGTEDATYRKGAVRAAAKVYASLASSSSLVKFVDTIDSTHLLPGVDPHLCWWEEMSGPDNCTFDGAGEALSWIHGPQRLAQPRRNDTVALNAVDLYSFDQRPFFAAVTDGRDPLFADTGRVFVPKACAKEGARCDVAIFLHGCGVSFSYDTFTRYAGFNEWAANNHFVVLYPQAAGRGKTKQMQSGCMDGYGDTGKDYTLRSAPQMRVLAAMIKALGASGG